MRAGALQRLFERFDAILRERGSLAMGGQIDRKSPSQPPKLNAAHQRALARMIEDGPIPAVHVRWRLIDLMA
jgi:hypothetical protein